MGGIIRFNNWFGIPAKGLKEELSLLKLWCCRAFAAILLAVIST
jgi:hypothetical protein